MAATPALDTQFEPQTGTPVAVAPGLVRLTAPNGGPYTFTGTNTFLAGVDSVAVIDPGPDLPTHLAALQGAIAGRPVSAIILTHTHRDHCALAPALREATGAPLWFAAGGRWSEAPDRVLGNGERLQVGGVALEVIATPGHSADHLCLGVADSPLLLSGDHVMGWSSTLIAPPGGDLADYFASLERLIALPYRGYLPAHGGPIADGPGRARQLMAHRQHRNAQILDAVAAGASSIEQIAAAVYPTHTGPLASAARLTVAAHVDYLAASGAMKQLPD